MKMNLNLKQIINDLLLQESVREVDAFIAQQKDEINRNNFIGFFDKFKNFSSSNPNQLGPISVTFFKWLFSVSFQQNPNITDQELNHFFDISILYFNNKNKFSFNFKNNPPTWNAFEIDVLEKTSEQREKWTEESTLVQLISKDINTKWFKSNNSKVNKPEIIKKFKTWNENSKLSKQEKENNILVIQPRTTLSAKFWGNPRCFGVDVGYGVKWCTSATESGNMFHHYTQESGSILVYIIDLDKLDQDPWQKIAVLIKRNGDIEIFDATDKKYSIEEIQSDIKPENLKLINEIINDYLSIINNQYSPSQFRNLSQEEKRILFLTSLRDPSSEDIKYIQKHFREVFDDPLTSENDRRQIINNLIGSSDYDETLVSLIDKYLNDSNANQNFYKYHEIIKHLNSPEKQSKAAAKFFDNRIFFENEVWNTLAKYLTRDESSKVAQKFLKNKIDESSYEDEFYFLQIWNKLSTYLNVYHKKDINSRFFDKFKLSIEDAIENNISSKDSKILESIKNKTIEFDDIINYLYENEEIVRSWDKISSHLNEFLGNDFMKKFAVYFFIQKNKFHDYLWEELKYYLTPAQKSNVAISVIFSPSFDGYNWETYSEYLLDSDLENISYQLFTLQDFDKDMWRLLKKYLTEEQKNQLAFIYLNQEPDYWNELSEYLSEEEKQEIKTKFNISETLYKRKLKILKLAINNII